MILSGTGADGSLGLKAVKDNGGLVIAQDPDEAGYDGMPRSAIMTGAVDLVLPVADDSGRARARIGRCRRMRRLPSRIAPRTGCRRSSTFSAPGRHMISHSTSPARCSAG